MNHVAQELFNAISQISEEAWAAGWMRDVEFAVWQLVLSEEGTYGAAYVLTLKEASALKDLSKASGGWWYWANASISPRFVPMEEWEEIYTNWENAHAMKQKLKS